MRAFLARLRVLPLACIIPLLLPLQSQAWSSVGHKTIAVIADDHLTATARTNIQSILPAGESLESVSTWADDIKQSRPSTKTWHYIDLPVRTDVTTTNVSLYCTGNDLLGTVKREIANLKNAGLTGTKRLEALKYLIHFAGDMTMPLHCADDGDKGGNEKMVRFYGTSGIGIRGHKMKLHALWDHLIQVEANEDPRRLATALEKQITTAQIAEWSKGSLEDWVLDTWAVAKNTVYGNLPLGATPKGTELKLPRRYYAAMRPVAEQQLEKAGIRLAAMLNGIFDPGM